MSTFTDIGKDAWDRAIKAAQEVSAMRSMTLEVGILEDAGGADPHDQDSPLTVAAIAGIHEFGATITIPAHEVEVHRQIAADGQFLNGARFVKEKASNYATTHHVEEYTITIPERSFIRATVDAEQRMILDRGAELLREVAGGEMNAQKAMRLWGEDVVARIRERISDGIAPPLAASTIRARAGAGKGEGGDTPLYDTGHLLRSITYRVRA